MRYANRIKPIPGMTLAFTSTTEPGLAGIPAQVRYVWPRCPSGDYLVTLEYVQAVKLGNAYIQQIEAFVSELEPTSEMTLRP